MSHRRWETTLLAFATLPTTISERCTLVASKTVRLNGPGQRMSCVVSASRMTPPIGTVVLYNLYNVNEIREFVSPGLLSIGFIFRQLYHKASRDEDTLLGLACSMSSASTFARCIRIME